MDSAYLSVFYLFLIQLIMAMLSKGYKPARLLSHNSQKFSFTNIQGLRSNFVECKSYLEFSSFFLSNYLIYNLIYIIQTNKKHAI